MTRDATPVDAGAAHLAALAFLLGWHYRKFGTTFSNRAKLAWILPAVWIAGIPYLVLLVASYLVLARIHTLATPRNLLAEELRAN